MNIINTPIADLKPYVHNPKTHPAEQIKAEYGEIVVEMIEDEQQS